MNRLSLGAMAAIVVAGTSVAALGGDRPGSMVVETADASATLAPADHFTGPVNVRPVGKAVAPSRANSSIVTFAPGSRSNWHSHPAGQTLIITAGEGWIETWGGRSRLVKAGDVIWTPPGVKHWHGATGTSPMVHVALQETTGGRNVDWLEPVSEAQYRKD